MSEVLVSELDKILEEMFEKKGKVRDLEDEASLINKEVSTLKEKAKTFLKALNREDYSAPAGTVSIKQKWTFTLPDSDEKKLQFFDWLKERGTFEKYATVNYNGLQGLLGPMFEEAMSKGEAMEFSVPGINEPKLFEDLGMYPKRKKKGE